MTLLLSSASFWAATCPEVKRLMTTYANQWKNQLLRLNWLFIALAQKIKSPTNTWTSLKRHIHLCCVFSIVTFYGFIVDNSSDNKPIINTLLVVMRNVRSVIFVVPDFLYHTWFVRKLIFFMIHSKNCFYIVSEFEYFDRGCCHYESTHQQWGTSKN